MKSGWICLQNLDVLRLPALRAFLYIELNRLSFLKAAESLRLDGGVMYEYILAVLAADETKAFGVVKPLYSSLLHCVLLSSLLNFAVNRC